eukprot:Pgem_evm1s14623
MNVSCTENTIIALQLKTELLYKHIESLITIYHTSTKSKVRSISKKFKNSSKTLNTLKQKFACDVLETNFLDLKLKQEVLNKYFVQYNTQHEILEKLHMKIMNSKEIKKFNSNYKVPGMKERNILSMRDVGYEPRPRAGSIKTGNLKLVTLNSSTKNKSLQQTDNDTSLIISARNIDNSNNTKQNRSIVNTNCTKAGGRRPSCFNLNDLNNAYDDSFSSSSIIAMSRQASITKDIHKLTDSESQQTPSCTLNSSKSYSSLKSSFTSTTSITKSFSFTNLLEKNSFSSGSTPNHSEKLPNSNNLYKSSSTGVLLTPTTPRKSSLSNLTILSKETSAFTVDTEPRRQSSPTLLIRKTQGTSTLSVDLETRRQTSPILSLPKRQNMDVTDSLRKSSLTNNVLRNQSLSQWTTDETTNDFGVTFQHELEPSPLVTPRKRNNSYSIDTRSSVICFQKLVNILGDVQVEASHDISNSARNRQSMLLVYEMNSLKNLNHDLSPQLV